MRVDGKEVNKLVNRRTTKFPWLSTKTTAMMMPENTFEESKFVAKFVADNEVDFGDISISDMLPIITENGKRRQLNVNKYEQIMKVLGYDEDTIKGLNTFNDEWIEDLWKECSKKFSERVKSKEKYDETKDDFVNRWKNAINKAKRGVVATGMMGAGHFSPEDSSVALKLGFAVKHGVTKVDAILLSKALEAKIEYMAKKMVRDQNVYVNKAIPGHRDVKLDKRVYNYRFGLNRGKFAAERSDKHVVSYEGMNYLLTDKQYKESKKMRLNSKNFVRQITVWLLGRVKREP